MQQHRVSYLSEGHEKHLQSDNSKLPVFSQPHNQESSTTNQRNKEKKIFYRNDHHQQQYFSIQRNNHQPSRHFSPERQHLELPIVNSGNIGETKQKRVNDFKNALNQTRRFRNGSLYDNYYQLIQRVKQKHSFDEDEREQQFYTYQTSECNRNKLLANAMFNITTPSTEMNQINQQTFFNLDINLWNQKQKQNLNNSNFALSPLIEQRQIHSNNGYLNQNSVQLASRERNLSLPPTAGGGSVTNPGSIRLSEVSPSLNKSYLNTNLSMIQHSKQTNYRRPKKHKTQQPSLSPMKQSLLDDNLQLKESSMSPPKKKILEINFATGLGKKYHQHHGGKHINQIIKTPYIDKAIQIIEEKQKLDGDDEEQSVKFALQDFSETKKKTTESENDAFIKIDGGYGDYILRYHHIKQRIQNKLIPEKVAMPELSNLFTTYEEFQTEQEKQLELEALMQYEATPLPSHHKKKQLHHTNIHPHHLAPLTTQKS